MGKKKEKKVEPERIELSEHTRHTLANLAAQIQSLQNTIQVIISTAIAEKGDTSKQYTLSPDGKYLVEKVAEGEKSREA